MVVTNDIKKQSFTTLFLCLFFSEPPLTARPLGSFRYTSTRSDPPVKLPSDFWSSRSEICDSTFGFTLVKDDQLRNIRATLNHPFSLSLDQQQRDRSSNNNLVGNNRSEINLQFCRFCGFTDCDGRTNKRGCRRMCFAVVVTLF